MLNLIQKNYIRIIFLVSFAALISAYFIEHVLGHQPCNLCIIERIPYIAAIILISLIFILNRYQKIISSLILIFFIFGTVVSFYHFCIEQGFFSESLVCDLGNSRPLNKEDLLNQLKETSDLAKTLMNNIIDIADDVLTTDDNDDYFVTGESHLMDHDELSDIKRLKALFNAFSEKQELLHILDKSLTTSNIQIFIGEESGYKIFDNCTLITAPYTNEEGSIGVLGVIGPTRMAYQRVIPIVDVTAKLLSKSLKS